MKIILLFLCFIAFFFISYSQKKKTSSLHKIKPLISIESHLSEDNLDKLLNSDYAKSLGSLKAHVKGHKVINSTIGNAGFILYLDNNSWALAFRIDNKISSEFGNGSIAEESINKINSSRLGNASVMTNDNSPYASEGNILRDEVRKSHGKIIEGLAIGDNTFNFAFKNGMELDFQLCNDKNNTPSIRVYWEQW